ncbi:BICD family-like cargo adapter 1 isoform X1 [Pygocentrus nattereri]|uniref:Si:ch211-235m3.5 n=1 Tax=Pygocentrus nattereri TaxID=42514 RepID=A0A3B4DLS6_PYGNA|nr:BICD family-like cargo adapter 1 isoform X1 [Pygocentrus nattereri]
MSRVEELCFEARRMELQEEEEEEEEDFYPYEFDAEEELPAYRDGDELLAALRRKEEEVLLAAQLGKALLLENRQLKEERVKLHEQYTDQVEELEQARHELRLKLQGCQVQWESQVAELERDVLELRAQVEELTQALSEVEREKSRNQQQHIEISQQLREQLHTAMEVERTVTAELQSLKLELRERGHPRPQDEELLSALREQVARLTQREQALSQRLETACEENAELKDKVSSLHTHLGLQEQQSQTQTQQLTEAWQEVEAARGRVQELQAQLEEMQEEVSLQRSGHGEASLLSEMEHSLDAMGWSQDKEQVTQEVTSILDMLLPVACGSEALRDEDGILQSMLGQLKSVAERIAHSQTLQELKQPIVEVGSVQCEKTALLQELRDQNARLLEENAELRLKADSRLDEEIVQRAIKDRDDAIAKKTAVEAELVRSKNDIMCLNNQLLEAIQRKLELSQELEAWQDDIQIIINQQLKSQHQTEQQSDRKRSGAGRLSFLRKSRKPSASPSCTPEISPAPNQSPWRDWLKLSK